MGEVVLILKFPQKGRLLQQIPLTAMSPSENLHQSLFFFTFPDLCHDRIPSTALQSLHPLIAIKQDKAIALPQSNHRQNLPEALDGTGQGQHPLRSLNPCMGITKIQMSHLDLFHFSGISWIHDPLTLDGGIDLLPAPDTRKNDTVQPCQTMPWHER